MALHIRISDCEYQTISTFNRFQVPRFWIAKIDEQFEFFIFSYFFHLYWKKKSRPRIAHHFLISVFKVEMAWWIFFIRIISFDWWCVCVRFLFKPSLRCLNRMTQHWLTKEIQTKIHRNFCFFCRPNVTILFGHIINFIMAFIVCL